MKIRNLISLAAASVLFAACTPSINPFYTENDLVVDARLAGEWIEKGKSEVSAWKFEKSDDPAWKLTVTEKEGKQGEFKARLFKLKEQLFLDLTPSNCEYAPNQADLVAFAMFPGHLLVRVEKIEPALRLAFCNYDWLDKHLENHPGDLAHHKEDKRLVLTAGTRELQAFVLAHLAPGELFQEPGDFQRNDPAPK
jgi:hypothetical protein